MLSAAEYKQLLRKVLLAFGDGWETISGLTVEERAELAELRKPFATYTLHCRWY